MISAQNHQLLLNGNKLALLFTFLILMSSCAARKKTGASTAEISVLRKNESTVNKLKTDSITKALIKQREENFSTISLLLPFKLANISLESRSDIEKSYLSLDFYQGFRLALDSLADGGRKIKLNIIDSQDDSSRVSSVISAGLLDKSELVVGPVFPAEIEKVKAFAVKNHIYFVSPLSPHKLSDFNNPYLIMVNSPLDAYATQSADFISTHYPGAHIIVLRSAESDDRFIKPLLAGLSSAPEIIKVVNSSKMTFLRSKLDMGKQNVIIVPSLDKSFWSNLMVYLAEQASTLPLVVMAHPSFEHLQFTNYDLMEHIGLRFASNYVINRTEPAVQNFIKAYKNRFYSIPGRYAFIGFDIGTCFGKLASSKSTFEQALTDSDFRGMHTSFKFKKVPGQGYENNSIMILKYSQGQLLEDK